MPGRHAPQPAGPGAREAPRRPDPPRRRPARRRAGRGPGAPVRLGVRLIPSCAIPRPGPRSRFAARHAAGGAISAPAAALAQEVLRTMLLHKLRLAALSLLLLGAVATGAGYGSLDAFARSREDEPRRRPSPPPEASPIAAKPDIAEPGRGPDVRRRPRARPAGQAGAGRHGDGLWGAQAVRRAGPVRRDGTRGDRPGGQRRLGPVPARHAPDLVVDASTWSAPSPSRRATASAGSTSTSTPISPPPRSRSGPSR